MKKFSFPLNTILNYKGQILDNLKNEHAQIVVKVVKKEKQIKALEEESEACAAEFDLCKAEGTTVNKMRTYENFLLNLQYRILEKKKELHELKKKEELKRAEVIEAKKETHTIEKLKEKKQAQYDKAVQKNEEQLIEEFVSHARSVMN